MSRAGQYCQYMTVSRPVPTLDHMKLASPGPARELEDMQYRKALVSVVSIIILGQPPAADARQADHQRGLVPVRGRDLAHRPGQPAPVGHHSWRPADALAAAGDRGGTGHRALR